MNVFLTKLLLIFLAAPQNLGQVHADTTETTIYYDPSSPNNTGDQTLNIGWRSTNYKSQDAEGRETNIPPPSYSEAVANK